MTQDLTMDVPSVESAGSAHPWRTAILGGMASYMDSAVIVSTSVALILYTSAFGLNAWDVGALSALLTVSLAIGALVGGRLGDLLGRRRIFTIDLLVFALGLALLAGAVNSPMLYVGVIITGFAMGADLPTSLALIAEEAPTGRRGRLVAFSQILWLVGIAVAIGLATAVSSLGETGARILYLHVLVVALVVWVLRRRMRESLVWQDARNSESTGPSAGAARATGIRALLSGKLLSAVVATGLFYAIINLVLNTFGQFNAYLYVNVANVDVGTASLVTLVGLPLGIVGGLVFMRAVDRKSRMGWFLFGILLSIGGLAVPLIAGFSFSTLFIMSIALGLGTPFASEAIYKVWSQELFPTLLRGTAQGATIAFTRILAAVLALFTPVLIQTSPAVLVGFLLICTAIAGVIGGLWVARLSRAARFLPNASGSDQEQEQE